MMHVKTTCALAAALLLAHPAPVAAQQPDPTEPSPQISKQLAMAEPAAAPPVPTAAKGATVTPSTPLRLKAIVLRDDHHGTALIASGDAEYHLVTLRREGQATEQPLQFGGVRYRIEDFSATSVVLQNMETQQSVVVH